MRRQRQHLQRIVDAILDKLEKVLIKTSATIIFLLVIPLFLPALLRWLSPWFLHHLCALVEKYFVRPIRKVLLVPAWRLLLALGTLSSASFVNFCALVDKYFIRHVVCAGPSVQARLQPLWNLGMSFVRSVTEHATLRSWVVAIRLFTREAVSRAQMVAACVLAAFFLVAPLWTSYAAWDWYTEGFSTFTDEATTVNHGPVRFTFPAGWQRDRHTKGSYRTGAKSQRKPLMLQIYEESPYSLPRIAESTEGREFLRIHTHSFEAVVMETDAGGMPQLEAWYRSLLNSRLETVYARADAPGTDYISVPLAALLSPLCSVDPRLKSVVDTALGQPSTPLPQPPSTGYVFYSTPQEITKELNIRIPIDLSEFVRHWLPLPEHLSSSADYIRMENFRIADQSGWTKNDICSMFCRSADFRRCPEFDRSKYAVRSSSGVSAQLGYSSRIALAETLDGTNFLRFVQGDVQVTVIEDLHGTDSIEAWYGALGPANDCGISLKTPQTDLPPSKIIQLLTSVQWATGKDHRKNHRVWISKELCDDRWWYDPEYVLAQQERTERLAQKERAEREYKKLEQRAVPSATSDYASMLSVRSPEQMAAARGQARSLAESLGLESPLPVSIFKSLEEQAEDRRRLDAHMNWTPTPEVAAMLKATHERWVNDQPLLGISPDSRRTDITRPSSSGPGTSNPHHDIFTNWIAGPGHQRHLGP